MRIEEKQKEALLMERVWKIYKDDLYQSGLAKIEECEESRIYCVHDFAHFLDVARLGYIFSLERSFDLEKELIYATALLHDLGRFKEYTEGISHDLAGAVLAREILERCDFTEEEIFMISTAISTHRGDCVQKKESDIAAPYEKIRQLQEVLYDADKLSRNCYRCESRDTCKWSEEKKNLTILW